MRYIRLPVTKTSGTLFVTLAWMALLHQWQGGPTTLFIFMEQVTFVVGVTVCAWVGQPARAHGRGLWPWSGVVLGLFFVLVAGWYLLTDNAAAGWGTFAAVLVVMLWLDDMLADSQSWILRFCMHIWLFAITAAIPVLIVQVREHFADEEFFVALQWGELTVLIALLWCGHQCLKSLPVNGMPRIPKGGLRFRYIGVTLAFIVLAAAGGYYVLRAYQTSFFPARAPAYPGLTAERPFECGTVAPGSKVYDGRQVFARYMALLAANANKGTPELGMLALGTGQNEWAQRFRLSLLNEAGQGRYTGASSSVKYGQFNAALRVYYYQRVTQHYPALFTPAEKQLIQQWFTQINRDIYHVDWVDWAYALAFDTRPSGPYLNQEIGTGLVSLFQRNQAEPVKLVQMNQSYLGSHSNGWLQQFRDTDDTLFYQTVWIDNKLYQSLAGTPVQSLTVQLSFDWLLLQALPDGAPVGYNHPLPISLAGISYLGAELLHDPRYVWLAGRSLDASTSAQIMAQPGVEQPIDLAGSSPIQGSCLLYGDSGLPTEAGPLGPDKIIFRDGWRMPAMYVLLNLRFTGWHRYKATNTVTLLYDQGKLAADDTNEPPLTWLPQGRSAFRDKRIPRENLNGLVVERTGLDSVLVTLLGGSVWAQDPPYYAEVRDFQTDVQVDQSTTVIRDWHGWTQARSIYLFHDGPVAIIDQASGPVGGQAALIWHIPGNRPPIAGRYTLRSGNNPAELVILPLNPSITTGVDDTYSPSGRQLMIDASQGQLDVADVFLTGEWAGSSVSLKTISGRPTIIIQGKRQIMLPVPLQSTAPFVGE